jgi:predicted transposase YbfD/YdcC
VLIALQPEAFQRCFRDWIADALEPDEVGPAGRIAIDGEACRRSHDAAHGLGPLHLVGAWASEHGIALGQVATEETSNEITAIPRLLEQIELATAVITIDATGCQKDIARDIVAGGGDFVIAVKGNQPKLSEAIGAVVQKHRDGELEALRHRSHETKERGHGRRDERFYLVAQVPPDFAAKGEWPWIKAIGTAVRITTHPDGSQSDEVRYHMPSRFLSGKRFGDAVRGHWGIGSMHWVLDVTFREDDSRIRERTLANNVSWLRRFAVTLLKRHPIKDSIRGKMIRCLMNTQFLTEVLTLP